MLIQTRFTNDINRYTSQVDRQDFTASVSSHITAAKAKIPTLTLTAAVVDRQLDSALRWMTFNKFGAKEYQVFNSEERLDYYLSLIETVDIWEIEDRREREPKTIYKCCDADDYSTFSTVEEVYNEISTTTDHGVFCIHDLNTHEKRFIQQKKGWFQYGFEEVSLENAQKTILAKEEAREKRLKSYALGIAALASTSVMVSVGKTLSKSWAALTNVSAIPSYPLERAMKKTSTIFATALLIYEMSGLGIRKGHALSMALPVTMLEAFSWLGYAKAQPFCPKIVGSYNTTGYAQAVTVSGNYAYVADGPWGLQIIDVSNVTNPTFVGSYSTPGQASGVTISGNYAYVGDGYRGLQIIDVSNVANPIFISSYDTPGFSRTVVLSGNYAYIAAGDVGGLQIIDVSNITNLTRAGRLVTLGDAYDLALSDNYVYIAIGTAGLQIIDVSNVANPTFAGFYDTPGAAYGIEVSGNYAYVADDFGGFHIIDVGNKASPRLVGSCSSCQGGEYAVALSGNYAFVINIFGLQIIDVSNVANPTLVGSCETPGLALGITLFGSYAYVADWDVGGLQIISLPCPSGSNSITSFSRNSSQSLSSGQDSTLLSSVFLPPTSHNPLSKSTLTSHRGIGWGVGIAGLFCFGITGTTLFYYLKKRKRSDDPEITENQPFELRPVVERGHKEIGEKYYQLSTISEEEAQEIYLQTGHLIVFPMEERKLKYIIGRGHFGAIKVAQRIEDGQYVVSKKVKGEEKMLESAAEANMQKEAAGANILPIYNTIKLEKALYHFMPLAGFGDGCSIQEHLAALDHTKLAAEILKFVAKNLLSGLSTIHRKGIYHLDIKPDNLVFTKDGIGYIIDFGCAKKSATPEQPSNAIGDNRYFSPERLQAHKDVSSFDGEKADIWAAGLTLLQITKNLDPHQLFAMPGQLALRVQRCSPEFFQEKLAYIKELQYPEEGSIWWVIKGLLDPNPATRFTADEALKAPCFKWLNPSLQAKVFEELAREVIAHKTKTNKEEVNLSNYRGIALAALMEEMPTIYESEKQQQYYDLEGYGPMRTTSVREEESEMHAQLDHLEEGYSGMPTVQSDDYQAPPEN